MSASVSSAYLAVPPRSDAEPSRRTRFWRRLRPHALLALPILLALGALVFAFAAWRTGQENRTIAALSDGRDVAVSTSASPNLLLARVVFLGKRDRLDEAEPLVEAIERSGRPELVARARYTMANSRLRKALEHLGRNETDPAGPLVVLSRQDYRRALMAKPDYWDAKFNFDFASRLIRDFPDFERKHGDEMEAEPKKIWTDIPGQPRGAP